MKSILLSLASVSVAIAPLSLSTVASAHAGEGSAIEAVALCKDIYDELGWRNVGQCVGSIRDDDNADIAEICRYLESNDLLDDYGFANLGECVTFF